MKNIVYFFIIFWLFLISIPASAQEEIDLLNHKAQKYIKQNDLSNAILTLQEIVNRVPDNPEYLNDLGAIYAEYGKYILAQETFQKAITIAPKFIKSYNNLGLVFIKQGKFIQGIKVLEDGKKKDINYPKIYSNLSLAYYEIKMIYKSLDTLEEGFRNCPFDIDIIFSLAALYDQMGWKNLALDKYRLGLIKDPDNLQILTNLSAYYIKNELFEESIIYLNKIISISPEYAKKGHVNYYLGYCYLKRNKYKEAEKYFKKEIADFPDNIEAHYQCYCIYRDTGFISKALLKYNDIKKIDPDYNFLTEQLPPIKRIREYSIFLKKEPNSIKYKLNLAEDYFKLGVLNETLKLVNSVLKKEKDNINALFLVGLVNQKRGNLEKAKDIFEYTAKKYPDNPEVHFYLRNIYRDDKVLDIDVMRENIRVKIKNDRENPVLHYEYGKIFEKKGLLDYAILEYLDVLIYKKDFIEVYPALIDIYLQISESGKALKLAEQMLGIFPDNELSYYNSGKVYYFTNNLFSAEKDLNKSLEINPGNIETNNLLRKIYQDKNQLENALKKVNFILSKNPSFEFSDKDLNIEKKVIEYQILASLDVTSNLSIFLKLGETYLEIGETKKALILTEKALEKFPDNINLFLLKGKIMYLEENFVEAEKIFNKCFKLNPQNPDVLFYLRNIYRDHGEKDRAIAIQNEILRLNPEYKFPFYKYLRQKQIIEEYNILITLYPDRPDLYYSLGYSYYAAGAIYQAEKYLKMCLLKDKTHKDAIELLKYISLLKKEELFNISKDVIIGAKHILLKTLEEAKEVKKLLLNGEKFESLAKIKSYDEHSAKNGGDLGVFNRDEYLDEFVKSIEKLKVGEISNIIKTRLGYHIIMRTR
ncbi:MAG: tetratricopeptide repeat protein [Candidatus Firestonebacteria bacterium]|nr:tetratricopeptide repeat protein [Candidatus Firestonebacteria bacterium]